MNVIRHLALLVSACVAAIGAVPAQAAQLVYEVTGASTAISFTIDEQPALKSVEVDGFIVGDILVELNGISQLRDIGFVRDLSDGGFIILGTDINLAGPQLFTGAFAAPTMRAGDFQLTGYANRALLYSLQVRPANAAVPEPSTWLFLLSGFGVLGAALRARARIRIVASG